MHYQPAFSATSSELLPLRVDVAEACRYRKRAILLLRAYRTCS
jgi:hypothetical protein